jgi:hypothetical protein
VVVPTWNGDHRAEGFAVSSLRNHPREDLRVRASRVTCRPGNRQTVGFNVDDSEDGALSSLWSRFALLAATSTRKAMKGWEASMALDWCVGDI